MFCYQCQETMNGKCCDKKVGVCGKTEDIAALQDLIIGEVKELSEVIIEKNIKSEDIKDINGDMLKALFMTITNANFFGEALGKQIRKIVCHKNKLKGEGEVNESLSKLVEEGRLKSILNEEDVDKRSLKEFIIYGIKGMAAYLAHARNLGFEDFSQYDFIYLAMAKLNKPMEMDELINLLLETGSMGVKTMALLDEANTSVYGHPSITEVNIGVRNNPAILVSGHDLKDLAILLEETKGTGVDVYTHGEMLPAHYYPFFKKYDHFVGNYGNAWWMQTKEFDSFNGPILFTTNCIVPPKKESIRKRIFTTNASGYPGCTHIEEDENGNKDFSEIIKMAKTLKAPTEIETGNIVGGFAHNQVSLLAGDIVEAVKSGAIRKFVVMAGCDGRSKDREYYTSFAKNLPNDAVILTSGCAKYRYNKLNLGSINNIPRVLDAGQCNDSYSLALIALKLKDAFELDDINDLPIFYNIAWYEQKAVIVLLALLSLGVKNIHLGPTLPGFVSENVKNILVENFNISPIGSVKDDLENFVGIK